MSGTVQESNYTVGEIFRSDKREPHLQPAYSTMGTGSSLGIMRPCRAAEEQSLASADVLHVLYHRNRPPGPKKSQHKHVKGWPLLLPTYEYKVHIDDFNEDYNFDTYRASDVFALRQKLYPLRKDSRSMFLQYCKGT